MSQPAVRIAPPTARLAPIAYAPDARYPTHAHAGTSITLVLSGSLEEEVAGRRELAGPLSLVVKPAGTPHADRFGPGGARTLQLALAPGACAPLHEWGSPLGDWRWLHGGEAARAFVRLASADGADREAAAADLFAVLAREAAPQDGEAPAWLARVRERIDDGETARVRELARGAGVHPVYLARQFRRFYGCGVAKYLRRRRVRDAAARLAEAGGPIAPAAYAAGSADQSHLGRDFRRELGVTPAGWRALVRRGPIRLHPF